MGASRERGIRKTGSGWQVYVRVKGEYRSKHFPPDTSLVALRRWRDEQVARGTLNLPQTDHDAPTLAQDAPVYLELVTGMVTYENRARMIRRWVDLLGTRPRKSLTALDIRRGLEQLMQDGHSPGTLNLYRTSLMHLFTLLDGKSARNPVRDVPRYHEPEPRWQLPTVDQARRAVEASGRTKLTPSRVRLECLLWTGWPPKQLQQLTADRIDLKRMRVRVPGRHKGRRTDDVTLPILPYAANALKRFIQIEGWGYWNDTALRNSLKRGCRIAKVPEFRVYDLRHVFGTMVATLVKDDRVVAELLQHKTLTMTRRYTRSSVNPRLTAALSTLAKHLR